jgi:Gas vesicle synthesis protein GvpL/GvpF
MKGVVIGAHLRRDDVEPLAEVWAARDVFLSALPVPDDQPLGDRDLLLRVASVRAELLDRATFIAIRYGFSAASAPEAESKCAVHLARWRELLERHRDHVEMTLKIVAESPRERPDRRDFASGAEYLRALHEATRAADVDPEFRRAVEETLVPLAVAHRWLHRDGKSLELAMLVPRPALYDVRAAGEALRETNVAFLLSGPWPLEVFADADHE